LKSKKKFRTSDNCINYHLGLLKKDFNIKIKSLDFYKKKLHNIIPAINLCLCKCCYTYCNKKNFCDKCKNNNQKNFIFHNFFPIIIKLKLIFKNFLEEDLINFENEIRNKDSVNKYGEKGIKII